jgi:hypothetical protein
LKGGSLVNRFVRAAIAAALTASLLAATAAAAGVSPASVTEKAMKKMAQTYSKKYARQYARTYAEPGPEGPQGLTGPQGATGPAGIARVQQVDGAAVPFCAYGGAASCVVVSANVDCPAGTYVVGGGYREDSIEATVTWSRPVGPSTWGIIMVNHSSSSGNVTPHADCVSGPGVTAAKQAVTPGSRSDFNAALAVARAQVK